MVQTYTKESPAVFRRGFCFGHARSCDRHLKYHLTTAALLTADQRHRYARLRGYL